MKDLLEKLADSERVLVAGSYARGQQTDASDIDFQIKTPMSCVMYGERNPNVAWVINLLNEHGIKFNSTRTGYLSTIGEDNPNLPIELEFYDDFHRNKDKPFPCVEIMGVNFKIY